MTQEEIQKEIETLARTVFAKPDLVLTRDLNAASLDTWTSLSFTQFLTAIEDKFGFKFKMMEILGLQDMGAVVDATLRHLN